ncbi:hypothetical protein JCM10213_007070 [Rhodosporidiobolus nylandii]
MSASSLPSAASTSPAHLTDAELSLLTLSPAPPTFSETVQAAASALPIDALSTPFARSLLRFSRHTEEGKLRAGLAPPQQGEYSEEDLLAVGVAALHAYAQVNWTGPALGWELAEAFAPLEGGEEKLEEEELNEYAIDQLALAGEPVYHLSKGTGWMLVALQVFGLVPSPFASSTTDSTDPSAAAAANPATASAPFHSLFPTLSSLPIWRLRAGIMWLKILDEPVPLPSYIAQSASSLRLRLPAHSPARASLTLSLSLLASLLSRATPHSSAQKEATTLAQAAAEEARLEWELTGRMGKRTKWQVDEKTQLVVLARDGSEQPAKAEEQGEKKAEGEDGKEKIGFNTRNNGFITAAPQKAGIPQVLELNDDTLLERTAFTFTSTSSSSTDTPHLSATGTGHDLSSLDPSSQPHITSFSQSVLLSLSLATLPAPTSLMHLSSDVLSTSQISAFVARVLSDPQNWSVHSMALLLRCRAEAGRSRTVERGVLQMQALVDQLKDGSPTEISAISSAVKPEDVASARDRLEQFHALALPPAWEMERELAVRYMALGITKSALEIFTRLELWEEVARCWMSLERPDRGTEIIRELLTGSKHESDVVMNERKGDGAKHFKGGEKREAKLWCTLGELERDPKHYERAWEVSGGTSSRAQRSLGAVYWSSGEYAKAADALRKALRINPLFPRTWFMLGCCEMRLEDWAGAQEAFGRAVGLENDDAESWSNLASCHLRRGELEGDGPDAQADFDEDLDEIEEGVDSTGLRQRGEDEKEAQVKLPFSRKRAAFQCLRQAIKHSYDSWRLWYNYMVVSVDVGELSEACRALDRMVSMRVDKDGEAAVDIEVLERLVDAVTRVGRDEDEKGEEVVDPNSGKGLLKPVQHLLEQTILPRVSDSPRIFLAHARLLLALQDYGGALDAHLKAYRAQVSDPAVERDLGAFKAAAERVEEVVTMLENLGEKDAKDGGVVAKDWKFQARSLVRTFLGRTKDAFEDEDEYERLKELLKELR